MRQQGRTVVFRLPLAMLAASLVSLGLGSLGIETLISSDSGILGVVIAAVVGGLMPGGPMIAFPIALSFWRLGAGEVQMVVYLCAWSIFSINRVIAFELPLMGWSFVALRMVSGAGMPFLAGLLAWFLLAVYRGDLSAAPPAGHTP